MESVISIVRTSLTAMLVSLATAIFAKSSIDTALTNKLKQMYMEDQKWRKELIKLQQGKGSTYDEETIEQNMGRADSVNYMKAKRILNKYGFPGYKLVGEDGSDRFWAIVQHCDNDIVFQQKVLELMYPELKKHNASGENYAYLKDRILVSKHQKQLYGTQLKYDPATKHSIPFPIADQQRVDQRRKAMGMNPLDSYLKEVNQAN